ncbi:MAG: hypothetical protein VKJ04_06605 [Vampirovibrionales bacterium]|nr:hypothetical protein [Vampirovibrionales bacterium]
MILSKPSSKTFSACLALGLIGLLGVSSAPTAFSAEAVATSSSTTSADAVRQGQALKGGVIRTDRFYQDNPTINEDDIREVEEGTALDMTISTGITTGLSAEGDEFFAKVTKDYVVGGKVVIPKGTLVHGSVKQMADRKRAGRNGWIATKFDYMITPDGREIPIEGQHTTRDNKLKAAAKVVGRTTGFTAAGGVVGALMVLRYGGLPLVAATEGYALAGGAAIGGAVGLTAAMVGKGKSAMIPAGADIRVKLAEPLQLPTVNMPDAKVEDVSLPGLNVKILGYRFDKDPFGEPNEITMSLQVDNRTEYTFSSFEIGLQDEYGNTFYPSPFGDSGIWFQKLGPNSKMTANVTFNVDSTKRTHKLIFFKQYTREPLAKFALTDDMQIGEKSAKAKKAKEIDKKAEAASDVSW